MNYQHRFRVQAPLQAVADFHSYPDAMAAITPPPIFVQVHQAPPRVADGEAMDFTMWLGPLPLRWRAPWTTGKPMWWTNWRSRCAAIPCGGLSGWA